MANFFDILRQTLMQSQGLMQDNVPSGNPLDPYGEGMGTPPIAPSPEEMAANQAAAEAPGQEITVNGSRAVAPPMDPRAVDASQYLLDSPVSLNNTAWAQEAVAAREANDKGVEHKGMFGMKGTLRDILGTIGDAFLVQGGADRVYAPTRQRERQGDAMAGMTQAPRAAVERMTAVDPELARQMGKDVTAQEIAQETARRLAEKEKAALRTKGVTLLSQAAGASNPETYDRMKPIMEKLIGAYGLGDEYKLPDTYDENYLTSLQYSGMPPKAQEGVRQGERRLDQGDTRNSIAAGRASEAARHNRETESAARARIAKMGGSARARADTPLEYFRELENIPADKRSSEENAWIKNYTGQNKGSSGRSARGGTSAPRSSRFRPVK